MNNHTEAIAQVCIIDISRSKVLYIECMNSKAVPYVPFNIYASQKVPGVHEDIKNPMPM